MKSKVGKVLNIIVDIIVVCILIVSILIVTLSLTSKSSGVPNVFGVAPLSVQSDSMAGTFDAGDLLLSEVTNNPDIKYKKGDIVTFPIEIAGVQTLNTHRIVEVIEDSDITYYKTQGDNKTTNPVPDEELQTSSTIVARYTGNKIANVGTILSFIRTQLGFFLCVLLPMIIFFVYEAIRVVINVIAYNKEKAIEAAQKAVNNAELTEEQKKRAIEEYLASIGKGDSQSVQTPADK
ncbi:MAG: signal peptidase I [Ruminococcus sp.]|jgi:signal peptidase|nr:signal peptidase I [Ruminococcus sp.]